MDLEDILLKRFRVYKIDGEMVVREHYRGNYKAMSVEDLREFLTSGRRAENMFVKLSGGQRGQKGTNWLPLGV